MTLCRTGAGVVVAGALGASLTAAPPATASEIVDRDVVAPVLEVDRTGTTALVTWRTRTGGGRRLLLWGARDWATHFQRDFTGGTASRRADWRPFASHCGAYRGPP